MTPTSNMMSRKIIVKHQPAVLILIDGEPKFQKIEDSKLERVVNTPYIMIKEGKHFFLASDTQWFTAKTVMGAMGGHQQTAERGRRDRLTTQRATRRTAGG